MFYTKVFSMAVTELPNQLRYVLLIQHNHVMHAASMLHLPNGGLHYATHRVPLNTYHEYILSASKEILASQAGLHINLELLSCMKYKLLPLNSLDKQANYLARFTFHTTHLPILNTIAEDHSNLWIGKHNIYRSHDKQWVAKTTNQTIYSLDPNIVGLIL